MWTQTLVLNSQNRVRNTKSYELNGRSGDGFMFTVNTDPLTDSYNGKYYGLCWLFVPQNAMPGTQYLHITANTDNTPAIGIAITISDDTYNINGHLGTFNSADASINVSDAIFDSRPISKGSWHRIAWFWSTLSDYNTSFFNIDGVPSLANGSVIGAESFRGIFDIIFAKGASQGFKLGQLITSLSTGITASEFDRFLTTILPRCPTFFGSKASILKAGLMPAFYIDSGPTLIRDEVYGVNLQINGTVAYSHIDDIVNL